MQWTSTLLLSKLCLSLQFLSVARLVETRSLCTADQPWTQSLLLPPKLLSLEMYSPTPGLDCTFLHGNPNFVFIYYAFIQYWQMKFLEPILCGGGILFLVIVCWLRDKKNYFHYLRHFCQISCDSMVHKYQCRQLGHISVLQRQDRAPWGPGHTAPQSPKFDVGLHLSFNFSPLLKQGFLPHVKNLCSVSDKDRLG